MRARLSRPRTVATSAVVAGLVLAVGAPALAATSSPSPSPSASPSPAASDVTAAESATPSASPSPSAVSASDIAALAVNPSATATPVPSQSLVTGIDRYLPYPSTATAVGQNAIATVTLPLPPGLTPVVVTGTLLSVADNPGTVRIRVGTEYTTLDATTGGEWAVKVLPTAVTDNSITVEVRNTLELPKGDCVWDSSTSETIQDIQVGFLGRETPPQTIAGFFSPPVRKVTIISDATNYAEAEPLLATAAALARRYDNTVAMPIMSSKEFAAAPGALDPANGPKRIVRLVTDESAGTVTAAIDNPGVPQLTLTGPADKLTEAGAALSSVGLGLVAVPAAQKLANELIFKPSNTLTFAQLGTPRPKLEGLGRLTFAVPAPQSRFGGPVESMQVHLEARHTPVPQGAYVTLSLLWNNQIIAAENLTDALTYTADVTVPPSLMDRDNFLTIRADAVSAQGSCDAGSVSQSFQMDVDGTASTITATPGQSLADGFIRFPQSFTSDLHVAFGSGPVTPTIVQSCANLVISLQRASQLPFNIHTHDMPAFMDAQYPGLVVGATPEDATALKAPLRFETLRAVDMGQGIFTAEVQAPFAALEAFNTAGRDLLMLGSTAPMEESEDLMLRLALRAKDGKFGWFGFNGTIAVAQPQAEILFLNTDTLAPQSSVVAETRSIPWWWIGLLAVIVLVILARVIAILARRRRVRRRLREEAAEQAAAEAGDGVGPTAPDDAATPTAAPAADPSAPDGDGPPVSS